MASNYLKHKMLFVLFFISRGFVAKNLIYFTSLFFEITTLPKSIFFLLCSLRGKLFCFDPKAFRFQFPTSWLWSLSRLKVWNYKKDLLAVAAIATCLRQLNYPWDFDVKRCALRQYLFLFEIDQIMMHLKKNSRK